MGDRSSIFLEDHISNGCLIGHRERHSLGSKIDKRSEDLHLKGTEKNLKLKVV